MSLLVHRQNQSFPHQIRQATFAQVALLCHREHRYQSDLASYDLKMQRNQRPSLVHQSSCEELIELRPPLKEHLPGALTLLFLLWDSPHLVH